MQLFKSEWLREPRYASGRDARGPEFPSRYGVSIERDARAHRAPVCMPEPGDIALIERERSLLRQMAQYDRAA